ncbi:response regulator [Rubrolithibacter danxiaensis]|uniref:response regulator n=1 Tax=Rubrolithibacter danxiaensis TaxID=3390805 RepID=UPI003BF8C215
MTKVITIDDEPINHKIAHLIIGKNNLFDQYTGYTEALIAFEFIKDNQKNSQNLPDVILLDLNMPNVSGWDFLEMLSNISSDLNKKINVIIVSSSIDDNDKKRSRDFPFVKGFISKPLSPAILQETLNKIN